MKATYLLGFGMFFIQLVRCRYSFIIFKCSQFINLVTKFFLCYQGAKSYQGAREKGQGVLQNSLCEWALCVLQKYLTLCERLLLLISSFIPFCSSYLPSRSCQFLKCSSLFSFCSCHIPFCSSNQLSRSCRIDNRSSFIRERRTTS